MESESLHVLFENTTVVCFHPDLDNLVGARGEQVSSGGLIVHVNNTVLAVVEGCSGRSARRRKQNIGYFKM